MLYDYFKQPINLGGSICTDMHSLPFSSSVVLLGNISVANIQHTCFFCVVKFLTSAQPTILFTCSVQYNSLQCIRFKFLWAKILICPVFFAKLLPPTTENIFEDIIFLNESLLVDFKLFLSDFIWGRLN